MRVTLRSVGRYRLASLVGRAPGGDVYKAFDPVVQRFVTLKLLHGREGCPVSGGVRAFKAAAGAAMRLHHPSVVTLYDHGVEAGRLYVVMEMTEGRTLAEVLKSGRPSLETALNVGHQVLSALICAHGQGVMHGNLVPRHVVLAGDDIVKVKEFWGSRAVALGPDAEIAYRPPEQVTGGALDPRSDVYAAGALLYHLLAGVPPFRSRAGALVEEVKRRPPRPPSVFGGETARDFDDVVLRALAKRPEDRYPSAEALHDALRQAASGFVRKKAAPAQQRGFERRLVPAGESVFAEGDMGDCAYLIESGSVRITKAGEGGAPVILATLGRGEIFGEMALVDDNRRMAGAEAAEETTLVVIPREQFRTRLERVDKVTFRLIEVLVGRLRAMADEIAALKGMVE